MGSRNEIRIETAEPDSVVAKALLEAGRLEILSLFPEKKKQNISEGALIDGDTKFFVAYLNGFPAGCCAVSFNHGYAELRRLFVLPEARGGGVAEALVSRVEHEVRTAQIGKVMLESGTILHAAHRLYGRLGYTERGEFGSHKALPESRFFEKVLLLH